MIIKSNNENIHISLLDAALAYAKHGWRVFPCHSVRHGVCTCGKPNCRDIAKHPRTPNGCKDASTNPEQLRQWWRKYPDANIGIATGGDSVLLVVDADGEVGQKSLQSLGKFPETPKVQTGRLDGGYQFYFRYPSGSDLTIGSSVMPGIDFRGEGGYVIAPPSLHKTGRRYQWLVSPEHLALATAPDWLISALSQKNPREKPPANEQSKSGGLRLTVASSDDFFSHHGASEGERNTVLAQLAGVHYARGDSTDTIKAAALAWNNRCQPPEDEATVLKALRSAEHWRENDKVYPADDIEALPLPPLPSFPTLRSEAYQGLIGAMAQALEPHTEADPVGILLGMLTCFGNIVGRGACLTIGARRHSPALFVAIVGRTSDGKGDSWSNAKWAFQQVETEWSKECVVNGIGSGEGLVELVADPQKKIDDGVLLVDGGATDKRCLLRLSEMSRVFRLNRRETATIGDMLKEAWDGETLAVPNRKKTGNRLTASEYAISFVGDIQPDVLRKLLTAGMEAFDGSANRYLWCLVRSRDLDLDDGGSVQPLEAFLDRLKAALDYAKQAGEMAWDEEAATLRKENFRRLKHSADEVPHTDRAKAQVCRLAMIYALADRSNVIRAEHYRAALAITDYCIASAQMLFARESPTVSPLASRLLAIIKAKPGTSRTDIYDATQRNITRGAIIKALAELRDAGLAHCRTEATGGRNAECWYEGNERNEESPPKPDGEGLTSFVRSNGERLTLPLLLMEVQRIGGTLAYDDDGVCVLVVNAPPDAITPAIRQAMTDHDEMIRHMLTRQAEKRLRQMLDDVDRGIDLEKATA